MRLLEDARRGKFDQLLVFKLDRLGRETRLILNNTKAILEGAGATMAQVIKCNVYLANGADFAAMNEVYASFFPPDARPARTCVGVTDLVRGALIEIDCDARR